MPSLNPEALRAFDQGAACHAARDYRAAVAFYRRATEIDPGYAEAWCNLGVDLYELGGIQPALAAYQVALSLDPGFGLAHNNLGNALLRIGQPEAAEAALRMAVRLMPGGSQPLTNLGQALLALNKVAEAIDCHHKAVALAPDSADAVNDLAVALAQANRCEEALETAAQAIRLAPDYARPRLNQAMMRLKLGRLREGWAAYEWRWRHRAQDDRPPGEDWDGGPLAGRTLLLFAEQGYGDSLQFIRFVSSVLPRDGRVLLRVPSRLARLFGQIEGVDEVIPHDAPLPPYDCRLSLMSLPRIASCGLEDIPAESPYLRPDPHEAARWARRLEVLPGLKVGLAWAGAARPHDQEANLLNRRRSLRLADFLPLSEIAGVSLVSLQKDRPQSEAIPPGLALADWMEGVNDFAATAALVAGLDLVISTDSAVAHLAGALGKPVWILSRFDGCWRWLMDRDDSPWYPSARLFRQTTPGDWPEVVARVAEALRQIA